MHSNPHYKDSQNMYPYGGSILCQSHAQSKSKEMPSSKLSEGISDHKARHYYKYFLGLGCIPITMTISSMIYISYCY